MKNEMKYQALKAFAFLLAIGAASHAVADAASRAYVQRGLVAQYDGIDNAGTGSHDSTATTWKNLTGDTSLDGTCANELSWSAKGWSVSGDCKPVTVGSGLAAVISKTNCTIEVACKPSFVNKRFVYFSQYNGGTSYRSISLENAVDGKYRLFRTRTTGQASRRLERRTHSSPSRLPLPTNTRSSTRTATTRPPRPQPGATPPLRRRASLAANCGRPATGQAPISTPTTRSLSTAPTTPSASTMSP